MPESQSLSPEQPTRPSRPSFLARPRFWVGLLVTALWLAVMGAMWLRESGRMGLSLRQMGVSPEVLLVSWVDYEQWMWIEQNGRRMGLTYTEIRPIVTRRPAPGEAKKELPGYLMRSHTLLNLRVLGLSVPVDVATRVEMNSAFEMETMQAVVHAAGQQIQMQAFCENKQLYYRLKLGPQPAGGGKTQPAVNFPLLPAFPAPGGAASILTPRDLCGNSPLAEPIFLSDAVIPILTRSETLKAGERWTTKASDPIQGLFHANVQVTVEDKESIEFAGEKIDTWRLTEQLGQMKSTVWYDLRGRIVRRDLDGDLRLVQAAPAKGREAYPAFDRPAPFLALDRPWIKGHLDPALRGKPLGSLIPAMPSL